MNEIRAGEIGSAVRQASIPGWVRYEPYLSHIDESTGVYVTDGVCRLLIDNQTNLNISNGAWYRRTVQRVVTRAGAERAAHFMAEFNPAFERLEIHHIRIWRGEESIEYATSEALQVFRRETNLERLILNGRLTASLLIPDVRVGDTIEIATTTYGANPILRGKHSGWASFDPFQPWVESRYRLLQPISKILLTKEFNDPPQATINLQDSVEERRWSLVQIQRQQAEDLAPQWIIRGPVLQYSQFENWNEIARIFAPLYESQGIPEALAQEIDALALAYKAPAERAVEWLRLVQLKLRYFALSLGEGGLVPRAVEDIWGSRFGDCKDAAKLYVAGARRLGLEVCAVLVSTTHGKALDGVLPSPYVFDHCIVQLRLNDKTYWLDPTMQHQAGTLDNVFQPQLGWALPLSADTETLEGMNNDVPLSYFHVDEEFNVPSKTVDSVTLRKRIEYRFWAADSIRNRIANEGTFDYGKSVLKELQSVWPEIVETDQVKIEDEPRLNRLTTIHSFQIKKFWKPGVNGKGLTCQIADFAVSGELRPIAGLTRKSEIQLGRPRRVTHFIRVNMPRVWRAKGIEHSYKIDGAAFTNTFNVKRKVVENNRELVISAWSVRAAEAEKYYELVGNLQKNVLSIRASEWFGRIYPTGIGPISFRIIWFLFWALVLIGQMISQNHR